MRKDTPILFDTKENCCGCSACFAICPRDAIQMVEDEEGFLYPRISEILCIGCRKCTQVCPVRCFRIRYENMSVIGPRLQLKREMVSMPPQQRQRYGVRPSLSGMVQTRDKNAISCGGKLATDLGYIQNVAFIGDVKSVFDTVKQVFFKQKNLEDSEVDEVEITDDFGDHLLKQGRMTKGEYVERQTEAKQLLGV